MAHDQLPHSLRLAARRLLHALMLAALAGLAACGAPVKKPTIEVADVRIADFSRETAQLTVTLRVQNPNNIEMTISDLQATLSLADTEIGQAESAQSRYTLAASSTVMLPVRVNIALKSLPEALRKSALAFVSGGVPYKISGSVSTLNGLATVPFEKSGQMAKMQ